MSRYPGAKTWSVAAAAAVTLPAGTIFGIGTEWIKGIGRSPAPAVARPDRSAPPVVVPD